MRLSALCTAAVAVALQQPLPRGLLRRAASHRSKSKHQDVDAEFRELMSSGLTPTDAFTPVDVVALTLRALKTGDERFLHRFSMPDFAPAGVKRRGSTFEGLSNGQYAILRKAYDADIDDDVLELDADAYLRIRLDDSNAQTLVSLGWELERRRGVWLTSRWYWHDFRPEFHPGIGEEEWTRICG